MLPQVERPGTLEKLVTAMQAVLKLLRPFDEQVAWKAVTFGSTWSDAASAATSFFPAAYRVDPLGRVWFRGEVARAAGALNDIVVLPLGLRPARDIALSALGTGSVIVRSTGSIEYVGAAGAASVSLGGISYDTRA